MSRRLAVAALPLAAALAAVAVCAAAGVDQARVEASGLGAWFYGFFLDLFPLAVFALVYGVARVGVVAAVAPSRWPRRLAAGLLGGVLLAGLVLYPTYGGLLARSGFSVGSFAFMTGQPMVLAHALGALASALLFAVCLGLAAVLAGGAWPARGRRLRGLGLALAHFAALWWALAVLAAARSFGLDLWPRRPLDPASAGLVAAVVAAAFLPHGLLALRPRPARTADAALKPSRGAANP
ncbi:MAG: hypothetical protein PGN34_15715 [Methylobacterium frigidaeris]